MHVLRVRRPGRGRDRADLQPPHQIDLVVKQAAESVADGAWIKFTWFFSIYLRKQVNLITRMNAKCPKQTNRWTHLGRLLTFLKCYCTADS